MNSSQHDRYKLDYLIRTRGRELAELGYNGRQIAEELGCSPSLIYRRFKSYGILTFRQDIYGDKPSLVFRILSLYPDNSISQISRLLGISRFTVRKYLIEYDRYIKPKLKVKSIKCLGCNRDAYRDNRFCKTCEIRRGRNGSCPDCQASLYRCSKKTDIGYIKARVCKRCNTRFELVELELEF